MNKQDIVNKVKQFCNEHDIQTNRLVLGHGAAAVMHGIRESTNDLDVEVSEADFQWFWCMIGAKPAEGLTGQTVELGCFSFHSSEPLSAIEIGGVWVVTKEVLLEQYLWLKNHPQRKEHKHAGDQEVINALC